MFFFIFYPWHKKIQAMSGPILKQFKNQIHKLTYVQKSIPE